MEASLLPSVCPWAEEGKKQTCIPLRASLLPFLEVQSQARNSQSSCRASLATPGHEMIDIHWHRHSGQHATAMQEK